MLCISTYLGIPHSLHVIMGMYCYIIGMYCYNTLKFFCTILIVLHLHTVKRYVLYFCTVH